MRILILGKKGMLGSAFMSKLSGDEDFEIFAFDRDTLDVTDTDLLRKYFLEVSPGIVVNCVAYTAVDDCETNRDLAIKTNGEFPGELAKLCKEINSILVHFSTDYVFDGAKETGYAESDQPAPINVYGESKLIGEKNIINNTDEYYILRTSWLYGPNGRNFVDTIISIGRNKGELSVVNDQHGSPTYTYDLCDAVIENFLRPLFSKKPVSHEHFLDDSSPNEIPNEKSKLSFGLYHATNSGVTTWYDFAKKIFEILEENVIVNPVDTANFPRPAKRPNYSTLLNTKFPLLRSWSDAVTAYVKLQYNK